MGLPQPRYLPHCQPPRPFEHMKRSPPISATPLTFSLVAVSEHATSSVSPCYFVTVSDVDTRNLSDCSEMDSSNRIGQLKYLRAKPGGNVDDRALAREDHFFCDSPNKARDLSIPR